MTPHGILETALYAADLEATERFYTSVLGLDVIGRTPGRHVFFRCGRGVLLVFNPDTTARETVTVGDTPVPLHGARGPGHMAFAVEASELANWRERLGRFAVPIEAEVAWPNGGHSIYFRDPAGNSIELATPKLWGIVEHGHRES